MALLKVSDNYSAYIVGNFSSSAETITVDVAPVKTSGYLTVFDLNGNQLEKIKYTGVSGLNLTGCIRGLSFDDNSDTPVVGLAQDLKNGMAIKMTVTQHYINPIIDVINGTNPFEDIPKNPSSRIISDNRHLTDKEYVDGISSGGILSMLVSIDSGLNININAGIYILNGVIKSYAGASSEPLTDDDTNYIQLVDGVLDINVDGFDDNAIPLAEVVCASGEIVTLTDKRPFYTGFDLQNNSGLIVEASGLKVLTDDLTVGINGSGQLYSMPVIPTSFGGTGSDGALTISSGTTTINLNSLPIKILNYTSISITGTGNLAFSNPHNNGTIIIIKCQGDVTITTSSSAAINLKGIGALGGTNGFLLPYGYTNKGNQSTTAFKAVGGDGLYLLNRISTKELSLSIGGGGGNNKNNDAGGRGGGALYLECGGSYTFTTGTIDASGTVGGSATSTYGGTGGGAGGSIVIIYKTLVSNTGTYNLNGGDGGVANEPSGTNGGGAGGGANRVSGMTGKNYNDATGTDTPQSDTGTGGSYGAGAGAGGGGAGGYLIFSSYTEKSL